MQAAQESRGTGLRLRILRIQADEDADAPHPLVLLRARHERPGGCAADECDERAALHSITSSASASSLSGTVRSSDLAVVRLMMRSNLVGCMTGRSAGFSPLRTRPT